MKKLMTILLCILIISGCTSKSELSKEDKEYNTIVEKIKNQEEYIEEQDYFNLTVTWQSLSSGECYIVTLDETNIDMYELTMVTYAGESEDDILPSVGIYDEEEYNLVVDKVDKENGYYKGLQVSGLVEEKSEVLVYIHYYEDTEHALENELYIKV